MRYLVIGKGTQPDTPPPPALMEAIMKLGEDAAKAGALLDTGGLAPSAAAKLQVSGGELDVTDGPFAESKEWISYAIYQVRTKEEAVEWTSRFLKLHRDLWPGWEGEAEVLQMFGPEDFAPPA
ncbi:YciI family protein [Actinopolymorpha alba]|uniref:YciI family protein n=1 Tax=Actinopolymorpha alba TaxID=533267 RepID=UPI00037017D8|nr:YciI family protein [Actinopolymorpha alba]